MDSVTREGPSSIQRSTCMTKQTTLHLNAFRGEPAISEFDWHFTRLPTAHPSILQHTPVRASTGSYTRFPLAMGRSLSFGSTDSNHIRPIQTRFRSASVSKRLRRLLPVTRWVIMQKARDHPEGLSLFEGSLVSGSVSLPSRGAFHLSLTVLVRYRWRCVFSLRRWSSWIPTRFLVSRGTRVSTDKY